MELLVLLLLGAVLYFSGALDWLRMAAGFAARQGPEHRQLAFLRAKLTVLKWLAREIGRTEQRLGEVEREP